MENVIVKDVLVCTDISKPMVGTIMGLPTYNYK